MGAERLLLITLLIRLAVIAAIAAVLVRSIAFRRCLYLDRRNLREKLTLVLFLVIPLAGGVLVRLTVANFGAADLSLEGAFLIGLLAGQTAGIAGGGVIALPAVLGAHEWLALPVCVLAGLVGALCRRAAPSQEEIWSFSPFIDLELWRWLRNRLNRPFRDWQALVFGAIAILSALEIETRRLSPSALYALEPHRIWELPVIWAANVLALAIPIKIWNTTRIELKLEEQRRLLVQARLDALTSQINPHFLFNTLNSVASLVRFDPDTARVLIVKLSNILRRLLRKHESFQSLREELALIDDYLDIEVVRFGPEKLRIEREIDPEAMELLVPSMLLQPLVENAIRHGLAPKIEGGRIVLRARLLAASAAELLEIEVEDDGIGIPPPEMIRETSGGNAAGHGIGLTNARERLRVLYDGAASLDMESRPGAGARVRLVMPATQALSETAKDN